MRLAVLGAGAGGAAATADLISHGHSVRLWNRTPGTLQPFRTAGGVRHEGQLGVGVAQPEAITADLAEAISGADAAIVCLPALAHEDVASDLASTGATLPVVLNPGHTGGALHFRSVFRAKRVALPPLAEFSTLTYVARKYSADTVTVLAIAERVRAACLPGGAEALDLARELFPSARPEQDVLAVDLADVNLVLHPPGALLGAAWVEATQGDYLFYSEGVTPGVARVIAALDAERLAIAAAFGHELDPLHREMAAIGTADRNAAARDDVAGAIRLGSANAGIRAPGSLTHRYYEEDFAYGLVPLLAIARIGGVDAPVALSLVTLGAALLGRDLPREGLNAARLGIDGLDRVALIDLVRGAP